jgi:putative intracellular protease/amidase
MTVALKKAGGRRLPGSKDTTRRVVVVVVPPVDELDLVGPLQVFKSVNRLAGRTIYTSEVVTSAGQTTVEGEGGVLTFVARHHFSKVEGACDSVLLVCGLASRSVRDPALSAWLGQMAGNVRRLGAVCVGAFLLAEAGLLNGRRATAHWKFGGELAFASSTNLSGSRTGTSTHPPGSRPASTSRSRGSRRTAAPDSPMKRRASSYCFCGDRAASRK